jgi:hypothetical protein
LDATMSLLHYTSRNTLPHFIIWWYIHMYVNWNSLLICIPPLHSRTYNHLQAIRRLTSPLSVFLTSQRRACWSPTSTSPPSTAASWTRICTGDQRIWVIPSGERGRGGGGRTEGSGGGGVVCDWINWKSSFNIYMLWCVVLWCGVLWRSSVRTKLSLILVDKKPKIGVNIRVRWVGAHFLFMIFVVFVVFVVFVYRDA